jgi:NitT/TauT family transport system substrate-binding protein
MRFIGGLLVLVLTACGSPASGGAANSTVLRLGYFPNVTHATAIVGIQRGIFARALGQDVTLSAQAFNAGPEAVEALFNGALDAAFLGPSPAINAFTRSHGQAIRIVAGATSGGASLVVRPGIGRPADLIGKTLATPQLGNTQDVALRAWLVDQGLSSDLEGGGQVSIKPQANGQALEAFVAGELDGAWVPEPWATRMVREGGGSVLVDERDLWPDGRFVVTHLVVATAFLKAHPDVVKRLLQGDVEANAFVNAHPSDAQATIQQAIADLTHTKLPEGTLAAAWDKMTFTVDPIASSLTASAEHAKALGLLDDATLSGIYDLKLLNEVLAEHGDPAVSGQ